MRFYVYRSGWNGANQSSLHGAPHRMRVAEVTAKSARAACTLAAQRVTVYKNQHLDAVYADTEDAEEGEIDVKA